jgi:hypothetical protein
MIVNSKHYYSLCARVSVDKFHLIHSEASSSAQVTWGYAESTAVLAPPAQWPLTQKQTSGLYFACMYKHESASQRSGCR